MARLTSHEFGVDPLVDVKHTTGRVVPETYRGHVLDPFQAEAIASVQNNRSVLVAAPTGTGKTLIADYLIEDVYRRGQRVIYTAPIKALSNQKFKEFKRHLGPEAVGILTGDVVVNQDAPILIMTTEIFRNLLHLDPERVSDVAYCIFDEIHYIDDPHRGSVWEESLIFMPGSMRFLGLSATIPNVQELADWIYSVQGLGVEVVRHDQRAVPLQHSLYESSLGICTLRKLRQRYKRYARRLGFGGEDRRLRFDFPHTSHLDLIAEIKADYLPCLFFNFSRRKCEASAAQLAQRQDFLDAGAKAAVGRIVDEHLERYGGGQARRLKDLQPLLERGIGYHHAGLLPLIKDIVEALFEERLLQVLYCTETFAVGLNFPCRTVCFDSYTKWDGRAFRALTNREYFQMAGRAGRRGIDDQGYAFIMVDFNYFTPDEFPVLREEDVEPLTSRFSLSYNTVLNLVRNYGEDEIRAILRKNFATFQEERARQRVREELETLRAAGDDQDGPGRGRGKKERRLRARRIKALERQLAELPPGERFDREFVARKQLLESLDFIRDGELTSRGELASRLNVQELLVSELFFDGVFHDLDHDQINGLVVAIDYEPRKNEGRFPHDVINMAEMARRQRFIQDMEEAYTGTFTVCINDNLLLPAYKWSRGAPFAELLQGAYVDEGDIVYGFRRGIDLLRQLRNACREDAGMRAKLQACIDKMDRDEVSIVL